MLLLLILYVVSYVCAIIVPVNKRKMNK